MCAVVSGCRPAATGADEEKVLSEKIDAEVAVPMYQAAYHYSAPQLLACSSHHLLLHYKEIRDPGTVPLY